MSDHPLIVLKFGGSVLLNEARLRLAVHEIYRWRRDGYQVVAVVSALAGQTDRLLKKSRSVFDAASPEAVAALVSNGELQSAALLGLHLDRAGVPACVLTPGAIRLVAAGHALDAAPVALDTKIVRDALAQHGIVVVPGYVAQDGHGRNVLLGRGGSDLTALFLAHQLRPCTCRLVKDVDGLYERDPAQPGPPPKRYGTATWENALGTDGSIVQHKAIEFARDHGIVFQLGRLNGTNPTHIGLGPTSFSEPDRPVPLRVAILGFGTVGGGVFELLGQLPELFEVVAVAVRSSLKTRTPSIPPGLGASDALAAATCGADVVVEAMGGVEPARAAVEAALRSDAHVVTANKALLAKHGRRLADLAASRDRSLRKSAAVGGSMPLLEQIGLLEVKEVRSVRAIVNGTCNFVLDQMSANVSFDEAVRSAQQLGFAEQDASRDLTGLDAADKLCVIADSLGGAGVRPEDVQCDGLSAESVRQAFISMGGGEVVRHVATLQLDANPPTAHVRLMSLGDEDPLAGVRAEQNAAMIELNDGTCELVRGRGAGRWPTAEAVVADLLEISRISTSARNGVEMKSIRGPNRLACAE